jgi:hypothetical protein
MDSHVPQAGLTADLREDLSLSGEKGRSSLLKITPLSMSERTVKTASHLANFIKTWRLYCHYDDY